MASAARRLAVSPSRTIRPFTAVRAASRPSLTAGQVARTLDELEAMGFIEKFTDDHNVTRYRPSLVAKRRIA
jgi:DNA-binding MarR family transcriptional regulator